MLTLNDRVFVSVVVLLSPVFIRVSVCLSLCVTDVINVGEKNKQRFVDVNPLKCDPLSV